MIKNDVHADEVLLVIHDLEQLLTQFQADHQPVTGYPNITPYSRGRHEEALLWISTLRRRIEALRTRAVPQTS